MRFWRITRRRYTIARFHPEELPEGWRQTRNESLHRLGDEWIRTGRAVALKVPSAVIRGEWNVLLNPAHRQYPRIEFGKPEPFEFDARMFR
jgi:RES domain-containing protein